MVKRKQPSCLKVIDDKDVDRIHNTSLRILYEVGVRVPNAEILEKFAEVGAEVNFSKQVVKIPEELVNKAFDELPKDFSVIPPDGGPPIQKGQADLQLSMDTTPDIVDVMNNKKRRGTADDTLKGIAVANALDNVRLATAYSLPSEVPQQAADVYCYELLYTYSNKASASWIYSSRSADYIIEMAKIKAGGEEELKRRKLLTYFAEPVSPLQYAPHTLEIILKMSEYRQPIYLGPMVTMGGSGPVTLAGTLALHNAEILHGLTIIYLCNPDQPVIYSCHCHSMDMAGMQIQYGAPEQSLLAVAATQLADRYGLFISGNVMLTDSNTLDYMAGFQEAATAAYALAAGWDMLGFMGFGTIGVVGNGVGHSLEKVIIQDEALSYLQRMLRSFEVDEETLAFDVIREAGIGGHFFATDHTVQHMRDEIWRGSGLFKNYSYDSWTREGAETITDRAHERLNEIMTESFPLEPVLPMEKVNELRKLTRKARENLR